MSKTIVLILALIFLVFTPRDFTPAQTDADGPTDSGGAYRVLLPNGPLPDTGYAVEPPPERYYDNTTLELIPADDYGRIWPYIGG